MRSPKNSQTSKLSLPSAGLSTQLSTRLCSAFAILTGLAFFGPTVDGASDLTVDRAMVRAAVGKLKIPAQRTVQGRRQHFIERCSATLVSADIKQEYSAWLVSAWHCFEYYQDLSRSISFTGSTGTVVNARLVRSGGGMRDDWALLRLSRALPGAVPLSRVALTEGDPLLMAGFPKSKPQEPHAVALAGAIEETPQKAERASHESTTATPRTLRLARDCRITNFIERDVQSDCVLPAGSSGGAVFSSNTDLSSSDEARVSLVYQGVISRGDSTSLSIFVPLKRFQTAILKEMRNNP
ncbi:MAG: trypsin-like peptidase domain-containing protein [Pseudomonadota bacterium]